MKMKKKRYDQLSGKAQLRPLARARRRDTLVERPDGEQEAQDRRGDPLWFLRSSFGKRTPPKFRPYSDRYLGPVRLRGLIDPKCGVLPLEGTPPPSAFGWWITRTADGIDVRYYSAERFAERIEALRANNSFLHEHEEFYPYTPMQNPEKSALDAMYAEVDAHIAALVEEEIQ